MQARIAIITIFHFFPHYFLHMNYDVGKVFGRLIPWVSRYIFIIADYDGMSQKIEMISVLTLKSKVKNVWGQSLSSNFVL